MTSTDMKQVPDVKRTTLELTKERVDILDGLSEVELFFAIQRVRALSEQKDCDGIHDHIVKLLVKFDVCEKDESTTKKFDAWLKFWMDWQSKLTLDDMKLIIDCIELKLPYESVLPKNKWNQRNKKTK